MKKFVMLFALLSLAFYGCSEDPMLDPTEEALLTEVEAKANMGKAVERPFKIRSSGTFEIVESNQCDPLLQYRISGQGNATHLGNFTVELTWCTDFGENTYITGTTIAANGDEQYFYSISFGEDEIGEYTDYIFEGGTGRFEDLTGDLRLYVKLFEVTTATQQGLPIEGIFANQGVGTLTY